MANPETSISMVRIYCSLELGKKTLSMSIMLYSSQTAHYSVAKSEGGNDLECKSLNSGPWGKLSELKAVI